MQGLDCRDALRVVDRHVKADYFWVLDAELQSYFDTIPHAPLLAKVGTRIADARMLLGGGGTVRTVPYTPVQRMVCANAQSSSSC